MAELTKTDLPLTFSDRAVEALKQMLAKEELGSGKALRVGVKGGGCAGMSYVLGIDEKTEHDEVYELEGLTLYMDKRHMIYLINMEVDYSDGLNARGFTFNNPNATDSCGCGISFAV